MGGPGPSPASARPAGGRESDTAQHAARTTAPLEGYRRLAGRPVRRRTRSWREAPATVTDGRDARPGRPG